MKATDTQILELSIRALSLALNELVDACTDERGKPKTPDYRTLMKARGSLPPYCPLALTKKESR